MIWILLILLVGVFLALDLGVFNRDAHVIGAREALRWTALWVSLSLSFAVFLYFGYEGGWFGLGAEVGLPQSGHDAAVDYLTGYLVEFSLSMDNVFVIALIFSYFGIAPKHQHRVLFWGILGAVVFRGALIAAGAVLLERFAWIVYVFGAILLYSAYKMWNSGSSEVAPEANPLVRLFKRVYPVSDEHADDHFFVVRDGVRMATPALVALLVVETSDVLFAFDSIPAIFAITRDPFLVFSSNIFAILGLRSLYFVLASMLDRFHLLKYALVVVLAFVGVKIILAGPHIGVHISSLISLAVIVIVLGLGVVLSLRRQPTTIEVVDATPATPEHAELK